MTMLGCCLAQNAPADVTRIETRIPPQALGSALKRLADTRHIQVLFLTADVKGLRTLGASGELTVDETLTRLLGGTGLTYRHVDANAVSILPVRPGSAGPARTSIQRAAGHKTPLKSVNSPKSTSENTDPPNSQLSSTTINEPYHEKPLQEVVIAGTHIRGAPSQSTPLIVLTSQQLAQSGYSSLEEFMASLPQNLGAVGSGATSLGANVIAGNEGFGAGVDLRGLGPDSTLVLVNGHRLAPAGVNGAFADISVLPISAIERVEVLTSGASAIYGSDAVGGVVNFVLRKSQTGADSSLEYGGVTSGTLRDYRADQSFGTEWTAGSAFVSYEYHDQTPLLASQRSFSAGSSIRDLLPELMQNAVYAYVEQDAAPSLQLHGDFLYSGRHNSSDFGLFSITGTQDARTVQYQGTLGADWEMGKDWVVRPTVSFGRNSTENVESIFLSNGRAREIIVEIDTDGSLATLNSGPVRAAFGVQVRNSRFDQNLGAGAPQLNRSRKEDAVFAETRIPLISSPWDQGMSGDARLEVDLAGRYDHYSDFGSSTNPSVGLALHPLRPVKLRGTWSSSFAAPQLWELYGAEHSTLFNSPDPLSASGRSAVLILAGGNHSLTAERSTQWTAGVDFTPTHLPAPTLGLTYYRIHYKDRIATAGLPVFDALGSGSQYSPFIQRNPGPEELAGLTSAPYIYLNATLLPFPIYGPPRSLSNAVAVADDREDNIGVTDTDGIDGRATWDGAAGEWRYNVGLNATYVIDFKQISLPGTTPVDLASTLYNPSNFKARITGDGSRGPFEGGVALNYVNHYIDTTVPGGRVPIASWTTVDVHAGYKIPGRGLGVGGLELAISCSNCLNRDPPLVRSPTDVLHRGYDPANANPLGRFVSLLVTKKW